jgi:transposase InsO family protein
MIRIAEKELKISMTEAGDPLDNAVAERVNGILKDEYLDCHIVGSFEQAKNS